MIVLHKLINLSNIEISFIGQKCFFDIQEWHGNSSFNVQNLREWSNFFAVRDTKYSMCQTRYILVSVAVKFTFHS